jgi:hypothetical protein
MRNPPTQPQPNRPTNQPPPPPKKRSPYTVCVASELAHVLAIPRKQLDSFLGTASGGLASRGAVVSLKIRRLGICSGGANVSTTAAEGAWARRTQLCHCPQTRNQPNMQRINQTPP